MSITFTNRQTTLFQRRDANERDVDVVKRCLTSVNVRSFNVVLQTSINQRCLSVRFDTAITEDTR